MKDMRVKILTVSLNPQVYNLESIEGMTYDEVKAYFQSQKESGVSTFATVNEYIVDLSKPHESKFFTDGFDSGDGSDAMINWIKVEEEVPVKWL